MQAIAQEPIQDKPTMYECYNLEEVVTQLFAGDKPQEIIEKRKDFLMLLHVNNDNLNNKGIGFLGNVNLIDTAAFNKVQILLKPYLPSDIIFAFQYKPLGFTDTSLEIYGLRNNTEKFQIDSLLDSAKTKMDKRGIVNIYLYFNKIGEAAFVKITENNINKPLALVIDGVVFAAPFVNGKIENGQAEISGNFTIEEGTKIVKILSGEK